MNNKRVYVVVEGMEGGYLPNVASYFRTKSAAQSYMTDQTVNARDQGYTVKGSARSGLYTLTPEDASENALDDLIELSETTLGALGIDSYAELEALNNA